MIGVTSFSQEGYEKYGHLFLERTSHFPGKILLYLEQPIEFESENVEKRNFFEIEGAAGFLQNIKNTPLARGLTDRGYNYNYDIYKFCRKMFCQFDAFKEGGKVIWLDADLEFLKPIPEEVIESWFEGEHLFFLGREGFYTETGIVGFDTEHKKFKEFRNNYINTLKKGQIFTNEKGWHDCYCFDMAREGKGNDLTPHWQPDGTLKGLDVLSISPLAEYMIHHKGPIKRVSS